MSLFVAGCKVDPTDSLAQFLGTEQQALRYFCLWKGGVQAAKLDRAACLEMMGNQGQDSESISMISLLQMLGVVFGESMDHTLRVMTVRLLMHQNYDRFLKSDNLLHFYPLLYQHCRRKSLVSYQALVRRHLHI